MSGPTYVAIEGIDGSGKTTICAVLAERLLKGDYVPVLLVEPSFAPSGLQARHSLLDPSISREDVHVLFTEDRKVNALRRMRPLLEIALTRPELALVLVQDRSYYSAPAYQCAHLPIHQVINEQERIAPRPCAVVLLDIPVETALHRQTKRRPQEFELSDTDMLQTARDRYREMAVQYGFLIVDAREPVDRIIDVVVGHLWPEVSA